MLADQLGELDAGVIVQTLAAQVDVSQDSLFLERLHQVEFGFVNALADPAQTLAYACGSFSRRKVASSPCLLREVVLFFRCLRLFILRRLRHPLWVLNLFDLTSLLLAEEVCQLGSSLFDLSCLPPQRSRLSSLQVGAELVFHRFHRAGAFLLSHGFLEWLHKFFLWRYLLLHSGLVGNR